MGVLIPAHIVQSKVGGVPSSVVRGRDHINSRVRRVRRRDITGSERASNVAVVAVKVSTVEGTCAKDGRSKERDVKERVHPARRQKDEEVKERGERRKVKVRNQWV